MGRTAKDRRDLPHPRPVERIQLNEDHTRGRLLAVFALLILGAALIAYSVLRARTPEPGWVSIEAGSGEGITCGGEFSFLYRLGEGGLAEQRTVTGLYTRSCRRAYQLFSSAEGFEDVANVYAINRSPNEALEVDGALWDAFAVLKQAGSRALYLGPVYARYSDLFLCTDDVQLADFDPRLSTEVAQEYGEIAAFANDPASIELELLDGNRVRLKVSAEYLAYAEKWGIEDLIDFSWMKNAFIVDYLARELTRGGCTAGAITSYDGFARNLDGSGTEYSLQLLDRQGETVYPAAELAYQGPMSIVSLRDYPANGMDEGRFYRLRSGEVRSMYLDPQDGLCRSAISDLVCTSREKGCGEILAEIMPIYIADRFQPEKLFTLTGIESIYCLDRVIVHTDPELTLRQLYDGNGVTYTARTAG